MSLFRSGLSNALSSTIAANARQRAVRRVGRMDRVRDSAGGVVGMGPAIYIVARHCPAGRAMLCYETSTNMATKLYNELAEWWPMFSGPEEYRDEAALFDRVLTESCNPAPRTLLDLGSGGGNNASHLKAH